MDKDVGIRTTARVPQEETSGKPGEAALTIVVERQRGSTAGTELAVPIRGALVGLDDVGPTLVVDRTIIKGRPRNEGAPTLSSAHAAVAVHHPVRGLFALGYGNRQTLTEGGFLGSCSAALFGGFSKFRQLLPGFLGSLLGLFGSS